MDNTTTYEEENMAPEQTYSEGGDNVKKRSFKVDDQVVDVDVQYVNDFLKEAPDAKEVRTYIVDNDTVDVELEYENDFLKELQSQGIKPELASFQQITQPTPQKKNSSQSRPASGGGYLESLPREKRLDFYVTATNKIAAKKKDWDDKNWSDYYQELAKSSNLSKEDVEYIDNKVKAQQAPPTATAVFDPNAPKKPVSKPKGIIYDKVEAAINEKKDKDYVNNQFEILSSILQSPSYKTTGKELDFVGIDDYLEQKDEKQKALSASLQSSFEQAMVDYDPTYIQDLQSTPAYNQIQLQINEEVKRITAEQYRQAQERVNQGANVDQESARMQDVVNQAHAAVTQKYQNQLAAAAEPANLRRQTAIAKKFNDELKVNLTFEGDKVKQSGVGTVVKPEFSVLTPSSKKYWDNVFASDNFLQLDQQGKKQFIAKSWKYVEKQLVAKKVKPELLAKAKDEFIYNALDKTVIDPKKGFTSFAIRDFAQNLVPQFEERIAELDKQIQDVTNATAGASTAFNAGGDGFTTYNQNQHIEKLMNEQRSLNQGLQALRRIETMPEQDMGGVIEGLTTESWRAVPLLSSAIELIDNVRLYDVAARSGKGEKITASEDLLLKAVGLENQLKQTVTPSMSYRIGDAIKNSLPFMGEFIITSGAFTTTKKGVQKILTESLEKGLTKKMGIAGAAKASQNPVYLNTVVRPMSYLIGATAQTAANPARYIDRTIERMTPEIKFALSEEGGELVSMIDANTKYDLQDYRIGKNEPVSEALPRAFAEMFVDSFTERFGTAVPAAGRALLATRAGKYVGGKADLVGNYIKNFVPDGGSNFMKRLSLATYLKKKGLAPSDATRHFIKNSMGWDGFGEEFFLEELPAMPLSNILTGDAPVSEGLVKTDEDGRSHLDWENLGITAASVGAMTVMIPTGVVVNNAIRNWNEKGEIVTYRDQNGLPTQVLISRNSYVELSKLLNKSYWEIEAWKRDQLPKLKAEGNERNFLNMYATYLQRRGAGQVMSPSISARMQERLGEDSVVEALARVEQEKLKAAAQTDPEIRALFDDAEESDGKYVSILPNDQLNIGVQRERILMMIEQAEIDAQGTGLKADVARRELEDLESQLLEIESRINEQRMSVTAAANMFANSPQEWSQMTEGATVSIVDENGKPLTNEEQDFVYNELMPSLSSFFGAPDVAGDVSAVRGATTTTIPHTKQPSAVRKARARLAAKMGVEEEEMAPAEAPLAPTSERPFGSELPITEVADQVVVGSDGRVGVIKQDSDGAWVFQPESGAALLLPLKDKTDPTETLGDLGYSIAGTTSERGRQLKRQLVWDRGMRSIDRKLNRINQRFGAVLDKMDQGKPLTQKEKDEAIAYAQQLKSSIEATDTKFEEDKGDYLSMIDSYIEDVNAAPTTVKKVPRFQVTVAQAEREVAPKKEYVYEDIAPRINARIKQLARGKTTPEAIISAIKSAYESGRDPVKVLADMGFGKQEYNKAVTEIVEGLKPIGVKEQAVKKWTFDNEGNVFEVEIKSETSTTASVILPNGNTTVRAKSELFDSADKAKLRFLESSEPEEEAEDGQEESQLFELGKQEVGELKSGTHVTTYPIKIYKGLFGKRNLDGTVKSAHPEVKGTWGSVDKKIATRYTREENPIEIDIPAGVTVEVIRVERNQGVSVVRKQETDLINASKAQVVKLITIDAMGEEEQYVIKDRNLLQGTPLEQKESGLAPAAPVEEIKVDEAPVVSTSLQDFYEKARIAHYWNSMNPDRAAKFTINDFQSVLEEDVKLLRKKGFDEDQIAKYISDFKSRFSQYLTAKGKTASSMVTGPSKFPVERNRKALDRERRVYDDFNQWRDKILNRRQARVITPSSELEKAKSDLAKAESQQELSKKINAIVRDSKKNREEKIEAIKSILPIANDAIKTRTAIEFLEPDFAGRLGVSNYVLKNNSANIRRLKDRIKELESKVEKAKGGDVVEMAFEGGVVKINYPADRVQIIHQEKPSDEVRQQLKSKGFNWSPSEKAWQRKITRAAISDAQKITGAVEIEEEAIDMPSINQPEEELPTEAEPIEEVKVQELPNIPVADLEQQQDEETDFLLQGEAARRRSAGRYVKDGVEFVRNAPGGGVVSDVGGNVRFTNEPGGGGVVVPFKYKLAEAFVVQPSHQNGQRNPYHFIPEAQPKSRSDVDSIAAENSFADDPRTKELGESQYPYWGAPVVNTRNEVIQGNNRTAGLRKGYAKNNPTYRDWLLENAEQFGFTREQVEAMENPMLVREVNASDNGAIELGNYDVKDLESGGKSRINPVAVTRRIPINVKGQLSQLLFKGDETLNSAIRANINKVMEIISPYLNTAQRNTIFRDGNITEAGISDLENIFKHFLFDGGDTALPDLFENLTRTQQEGLRKAFPYIFSTSYDKTIIPEVQEAILVLNDFANADAGSFKAWLISPDLFAEAMYPKDKYSDTALKIAELMYDAKKQKDITNAFAEYANQVNDKPATLLEPAMPGATKKQGIATAFNAEYDERKRKGEKGATAPSGQEDVQPKSADGIGQNSPDGGLIGRDGPKPGDQKGEDIVFESPTLRTTQQGVEDAAIAASTEGYSQQEKAYLQRQFQFDRQNGAQSTTVKGQPDLQYISVAQQDPSLTDMVRKALGRQLRVGEYFVRQASLRPSPTFTPTTATTKINSPADIAYAARFLENEKIEHVVVFMQDAFGNNQIVHLSSGVENTVSINQKMLMAALKGFGAVRFTLIHNHPNGVLRASRADIASTKLVNELALENDIEFDAHIIVDTDKGQYVYISSNGELIEAQPTKGTSPESETVMPIYNTITNTTDRAINNWQNGIFETNKDAVHYVASTLTGFKSGEIPKGGVVLLDENRRVVGHVLLTGANDIRTINAAVAATDASMLATWGTFRNPVLPIGSTVMSAVVFDHIFVKSNVFNDYNVSSMDSDARVVAPSPQNIPYVQEVSLPYDKSSKKHQYALQQSMEKGNYSFEDVMLDMYLGHFNEDKAAMRKAMSDLKEAYDEVSIAMLSADETIEAKISDIDTVTKFSLDDFLVSISDNSAAQPSLRQQYNDFISWYEYNYPANAFYYTLEMDPNVQDAYIVNRFTNVPVKKNDGSIFYFNDWLANNEIQKQWHKEQKPMVFDRPAMITYDYDLIPTPPKRVADNYYAIGADQLLAVNLILERFIGKGKRAFMLGDGMGIGKTRIELSAANEIVKNTGKPVLIITASPNIVEQIQREADALNMRDLAYRKDPEDVNKPRIIVGTYQDLTDKKIGGGESYGAVILDEAHKLKNVNTNRGKKTALFLEKADHIVFATGTPMDKPGQLAYFMQYLMEEKSEKDVFQKLGLYTKKGKLYLASKKMIIEARNELIKEGAYIRREFPFYGSALKIYIAAPESVEVSLKEIATEFGTGSVSIMAANRYQEHAKIPYVLQETIAAIEDGKHVVVFCAGVNETEIRQLDVTVPQFAEAFSEKLAKLGIGHAKIYGSNQEEKMEESRKFQRGEVKVAIATVQSGGTGIDLDDQVGNAPREVIFATLPFSGTDFDQAQFRVSRRNTKTPSRMRFVFFANSWADIHKENLVDKKINTLSAIQKGQDPDIIDMQYWRETEDGEYIDVVSVDANENDVIEELPEENEFVEIAPTVEITPENETIEIPQQPAVPAPIVVAPVLTPSVEEKPDSVELGSPIVITVAPVEPIATPATPTTPSVSETTAPGRPTPRATAPSTGSVSQTTAKQAEKTSQATKSSYTDLGTAIFTPVTIKRRSKLMRILFGPEKQLGLNERIMRIFFKLGVPTPGDFHMSSARALGFYSHLSKDVKMKFSSDFFTAVHEAMHWIDFSVMDGLTMKIINGGNQQLITELSEIHDLFYPASKKNAPLTTKVAEGLTMYVQMYLYNPSLVRPFSTVRSLVFAKTGPYYHPKMTQLIKEFESLRDTILSMDAAGQVMLRLGTTAPRSSDYTISTWGNFATVNAKIYNEAHALYLWDNESGVGIDSGLMKTRVADPNHPSFNIVLHSAENAYYMYRLRNQLASNVIASNLNLAGALMGAQTKPMYYGGNGWTPMQHRVEDYTNLLAKIAKNNATWFQDRDVLDVYGAYLVARRMYYTYMQRNDIEAAIAKSIADGKRIYDQMIIQTDPVQYDLLKGALIHQTINPINDYLVKWNKLNEIIGNEGGSYKTINENFQATIESIYDNGNVDITSGQYDPGTGNLVSEFNVTEYYDNYSSLFAEVDKMYDSINRVYIEMGVATGLIKPELAREWIDTHNQYPGYAPFYRYVTSTLLEDQELQQMLGAFGGKLKSTLPWSGSQRSVYNPIRSQMVMIHEMYRKGLKNMIYLRIAAQASVNSELSRGFTKLKTAYINDGSGKLNPVITGGAPLPNQILVYSNGVGTYYQVNDEGLLEFMKATNENFDHRSLAAAMNTVWYRVLKAPAAMYAVATTGVYIPWVLSNITVDQMSAWVNSKQGMLPIVSSAKHFVPALVVSWGNAFGRMLNAFAVFAKLRPNVTPTVAQLSYLDEYLSLAGTQGTFVGDLISKEQREAIDEILDRTPAGLVPKTKYAGKFLLKTGDTVIDILSIPTNFTEIMTRATEYIKARKAGKSPEVALRFALETTPFIKRGSSRFLRFYMPLVAYLKASYTVFFKYIQTTKERPIKVAAVTAGVASAVSLFFLQIWDMLDEEEKANYRKLDGTTMSMYLIIPKRFLPGEYKKGDLLFVRIPEQIGAYVAMGTMYAISLKDNKKIDQSNLAKAASSQVPATLSPYEWFAGDKTVIKSALRQGVRLSPNAFKVPLELYAGKRTTYTGTTPITPRYLEYYPSELQFKIGPGGYATSSKAISDLLGNIISPIEVEYLNSALFGPTGVMLQHAYDNKELKSKFVKGVEELSLRGTWYDDFYHMRDKTKADVKAINDPRAMPPDENSPEYDRYVQAAENTILLNNVYTQADKLMKMAYNLREYAVANNTNLPFSFYQSYDDMALALYEKRNIEFILDKIAIAYENMTQAAETTGYTQTKKSQDDISFLSIGSEGLRAIIESTASAKTQQKMR